MKDAARVHWHEEKLREHEPRLLGGEAAPHSYSGGTLPPPSLIALTSVAFALAP